MKKACISSLRNAGLTYYTEIVFGQHLDVPVPARNVSRK